LTAWERISSESIVTGFKNCCICNALDNTEDDFLWQNEENNETAEMVVVVMMMKSIVRMRTLNNNHKFSKNAVNM
jgi:hypothetical protein